MAKEFNFESLYRRLEEAIAKSPEYRNNKTGLAIDAGVGRTYVTDVLNLRRDPMLGKLYKVCQKLDVSPAWVIFGIAEDPETLELMHLVEEHKVLRGSVLPLARALAEKAEQSEENGAE